MENLFSTDKVASLQKKSDNAIGVLRNMMNDLSSINDSIDEENVKILQKIEAEKQRSRDLLETKRRNVKFQEKLNEFFEV